MFVCGATSLSEYLNYMVIVELCVCVCLCE